MTASLPTKEDLAEIVPLLTRGESAKYAAQELEAIFAKARVLDQFKDLVSNFHAHADTLLANEQQEETAPVWLGGAPVRREEEAETAPPETLASDEEVRMAMKIALDESGKLERSYSLSTGTPDADEVKVLDGSFHGWLRSQGLLCRGQLIYESDDDGEIKTNEAGEKIQLDSAVFKSKLENKKSGFKAFIESQNQHIQFEWSSVTVATPAQKTEKSEDAGDIVQPE